MYFTKFLHHHNVLIGILWVPRPKVLWNRAFDTLCAASGGPGASEMNVSPMTLRPKTLHNFGGPGARTTCPLATKHNGKRQKL